MELLSRGIIVYSVRFIIDQIGTVCTHTKRPRNIQIQPLGFFVGLKYFLLRLGSVVKGAGLIISLPLFDLPTSRLCIWIIHKSNPGSQQRRSMRGHQHKNEYFKKFSSVWKVPCNYCVIREVYLDCLHSHCLPTFQCWNPNFVSSINIPPLYIRVYRNHKEIIFQHELACIYIASIAAIFCISTLNHFLLREIYFIFNK